MEEMRPGRNGGKLKTGGVNPKAGRPKKLPDLKEAMIAVLADEKNGKTALDAILARLRQQAADGNLKAADMLLSYAYGRPKQQIDHTTGGNEIKAPAAIVFIQDAADTSQ